MPAAKPSVLLASPERFPLLNVLPKYVRPRITARRSLLCCYATCSLNDHRLDSFRDRQIVNLASPPHSHVEIVLYRGEEHKVRFNAEALASVKEYLFKRGITPDRFSWPPPDRPEASPFPGLSAFTESDAGIFFGRDTDILRGLDKLRILRRNHRPPRFLVIQAASGRG